jgi:hypothetical protein
MGYLERIHIQISKRQTYEVCGLRLQRSNGVESCVVERWRLLSRLCRRKADILLLPSQGDTRRTCAAGETSNPGTLIRQHAWEPPIR